jgi:hypothetical protein
MTLFCRDEVADPRPAAAPAAAAAAAATAAEDEGGEYSAMPEAGSMRLIAFSPGGREWPLFLSSSLFLTNKTADTTCKTGGCRLAVGNIFLNVLCFFLVFVFSRPLQRGKFWRLGSVGGGRARKRASPAKQRAHVRGGGGGAAHVLSSLVVLVARGGGVAERRAPAAAAAATSLRVRVVQCACGLCAGGESSPQVSRRQLAPRPPRRPSPCSPPLLQHPTAALSPLKLCRAGATVRGGGGGGGGDATQAGAGVVKRRGGERKRRGGSRQRRRLERLLRTHVEEEALFFCFHTLPLFFFVVSRRGWGLLREGGLVRGAGGDPFSVPVVTHRARHSHTRDTAAVAQ